MTHRTTCCGYLRQISFVGHHVTLLLARVFTRALLVGGCCVFITVSMSKLSNPNIHTGYIQYVSWRTDRALVPGGAATGYCLLRSKSSQFMTLVLSCAAGGAETRGEVSVSTARAEVSLHHNIIMNSVEQHTDNWISKLRTLHNASVVIKCKKYVSNNI